jgi:hypothetical protein
MPVYFIAASWIITGSLLEKGCPSSQPAPQPDSETRTKDTPVFLESIVGSPLVVAILRRICIRTTHILVIVFPEKKELTSGLGTLWGKTNLFEITN